jgi:hypothetical protein
VLLSNFKQTEGYTAAPSHLSSTDIQGRPVLKFGFRLKDSLIYPSISTITEELEKCQLKLIKPRFYFSDEWFCADQSTDIAIPFYFYSAQMLKVARAYGLQIEGNSRLQFLRYLRHEIGHAFDNAYAIHQRKDFRMVFGDPNFIYAPDNYLSRSQSSSHAQNINKWYSQTHPLEDFAETFAVCLCPKMMSYQRTHGNSHRNEKFDYVEKMIRHFKSRHPKINRKPPLHPSWQIKKTIHRIFLEQKKHDAHVSCEMSGNLQRY